MELSRRRFLQATTASVAASITAGGVPLSAFAEEETAPLPLPGGPAHGQTRHGDMLYRTLGRTGEKVSLIGVGLAPRRPVRERGHPHRAQRSRSWDQFHGQLLGLQRRPQRGTHGQGPARRLPRQGLSHDQDRRPRPGHRCPPDRRKPHAPGHRPPRPPPAPRNLRTSDADRVFAPGGSMEAVVAAKKAGKVRFIGFTGHKDPSMHLHMFDVADRHGFHFDTVQMPLNVMDAHFRSFARAVVPAATRRGVAVLAMKTMGYGFVLKSKTVDPIECLHYAMSLPVSVVITGMDKFEYLDQAFAAVRSYEPLDRTQVAALLDRTRAAAAAGEYERYKISDYFDGTTKHPEWMG